MGQQPQARPEHPRRRLLAEIAEMFRLALPIIVARTGLLTMVAVNTMMLGRVGAEEMAFMSLGMSPHIPVMLVGIGLLMGTMVITAQAMGAGDPLRAGTVWRCSLPYALLLGAVAVGLCLWGEGFYRLIGQTPEVAVGSGRVLTILGFGLPGVFLYVTTSYFLEGIKRPMPGMIAIILANLANASLAWPLIFGHWGLPALGAEGAAWATTAVRWLMGLGMIAYLLTMPEHDRFGLRRWPRNWWRNTVHQRRLGYAAGVANGLESTAFSTLVQLAGLLGVAATAAYAIIQNLIALVFMTALGLASATAVRVGHAYGAGDGPGTARAGWMGFVMVAAVMAVMGLPFAFIAEDIVSLFTPLREVIAVALLLVPLLPAIMIFDGGQVVMLHALRGLGDGWVPTWLHFLSYSVVMIPLSYTLAFPLGGGVVGLLYGMLAASVLAMLLLAGRFKLRCG